MLSEGGWIRLGSTKNSLNIHNASGIKRLTDCYDRAIQIGMNLALMADKLDPAN